MNHFKTIRDLLLWIGGIIVVITDILSYIELLNIDHILGRK